jgi:hypothetical protein
MIASGLNSRSPAQVRKMWASNGCRADQMLRSDQFSTTATDSSCGSQFSSIYACQFGLLEYTRSRRFPCPPQRLRNSRCSRRRLRRANRAPTARNGVARRRIGSATMHSTTAAAIATALVHQASSFGRAAPFEMGCCAAERTPHQLRRLVRLDTIQRSFRLEALEKTPATPVGVPPGCPSVR